MNEMAFRVTSNDGTTIAYDRKEAVRPSFWWAEHSTRGWRTLPWRRLSPSTSRSTTMPVGDAARAASPSRTPWRGDRGPGCVDRGGGRLGTPVRGVLWWRAGAGSRRGRVSHRHDRRVGGALRGRDDIRPRFEEYIADTRRAFDAGRDEEVLELFMRMTGASDDNIAARKAAGKQTTHWAHSVALAPTLVHDSVFLNRYQLPADRLATVTQPVLVTTGGPITAPYMAGLPSDFFDRAADELADLLPHAQRETLEGRITSSTHRPSARCCYGSSAANTEGPRGVAGRPIRHRASRSSSRQGHGADRWCRG